MKGSKKSIDVRIKNEKGNYDRNQRGSLALAGSIQKMRCEWRPFLSNLGYFINEGIYCREVNVTS